MTRRTAFCVSVLLALGAGTLGGVQVSADDSDLASLTFSLALADADLDAARAAYNQSVAARLAAEQWYAGSHVDRDNLAQKMQGVSSSDLAAAESLALAQIGADEVALASYVEAGGSDVTIGALLRSDDPLSLVQRQLLAGVLGSKRAGVLFVLADAKSESSAAVLKAASALELAEVELQKAWLDLSAAVDIENAKRESILGSASRVMELRQRVASISPTYVASSLGIPYVTLDAYQQAAGWARGSLGCDVQWWGLAGTGAVESRHGLGGGGVKANGDTVFPIRGIALDGTRSAKIYDSDNGVLDGDAVWDRAVGPTQFIPQTWRGYASMYDLDGNRDGVEDPDNMYDSARATASYLCRNSSNLTTDEGLLRAYFSYNHVTSYTELCLSYARRYETIPVADTLGSQLVVLNTAPVPVLPPMPVREDSSVGNTAPGRGSSDGAPRRAIPITTSG
jgi:membrane-bound lytic murein transglycosylase B